MEDALKAKIAEFFEHKKSFNSLLKANKEKFEPIVFQEFTDGQLYQDFLAEHDADKDKVHDIFKQYIADNF